MALNATAASTSSFVVSPLTPSILGPDAREVPISPLSIAHDATVTTVHVFPAYLDLDRLRDALVTLTRLYPVLCARLRRRPQGDGEGAPFEYFFELTNTPFTVAVVPAADPTLAYPFATEWVMQDLTAPYTDFFPHAYFPDNDEPLFGAKVTRFDGYDVLGLSWSHILSDGAGLNQFTRLLSRLYAGGPALTEADWPDFGEHVKVGTALSEEVGEKWDPNWGQPGLTGAALGQLWVDTLEGTAVVQFTLTKAEVARLRALATGDGPGGFVTEQDALTSYFLNLCRLQGVPVERLSNAVSYRTFHRSHPAFPSTLPRLLANACHFFPHPPFAPAACSPSAPPSLAAFATHLRQTLTHVRTDPSACLDWLATGALANQRAADSGKGQPFIGKEGHLMVNSNWGWDWHLDFGFGKGEVGFHTMPPIARFLRVLGARDGGAELSWRVEEGKARRIMEEVERDRREDWKRWE